jgi:dGTPase
LGDHYKDRLSDYYDKKWGFYDDDEAAWSWTRERALVAGEARSVNAVIMDIADDVTYAVHDVHDHFRAGLIPLHEFGFGITGRHESDEYKQFKAYADAALNLKPEVPYSAQTMVRAQQWLAKLQFPSKAYADTMEDRSALHNFESSAMKLVQKAVEVSDTSVDLPPHVTLALELLKELTWYYVINHPALSASQEGQRRIIRDLHEWLCEWASECYSGDKVHGVAKTDRNLRRLPARFRELLGLGSDAEVGTDGRISRAAVDFVVGLTDAEATNLHHHLGGSAPTVAPVTWL